MTIRTLHQVIGRNDQVIGEFMDLKQAKEMDNRTDVLYFLADLMEAQGISEQQAETIAEHVLNDEVRSEVITRLRSVKDLPTSAVTES
ncbi:MAG TPA: hypothetical protein DE179_01495 [Oceanospirillaceae bacterium]|nr:hypothetical protein [Oceanospirillaceae bacterium]